MPAARFRLSRLTIEGFKAFTKEQSLDLNGNQLFIFGDNGCGKSSIIEAIRWALFGLADRPETEIRNAFYKTGDCRVELVLIGSTGEWKLVRRLRPGSGRSDLTITNPQGRPVLLSDAFPHIARIGPREGTHIIYAAQHASGSRPHADISEFDKVLYSYLQLEEIPELLDSMDELLEEQAEAEKRLASEINDTEEQLRRQLSEVNARCDELLRNPPWGDAGVPTVQETEERIRSFAEEIARLVSVPIPSATDPSDLLDTAEKWTGQLSSSSRTDLQRKLIAVQGKRTNLRALLDKKQHSETEIFDAEREITAIDQRIVEALAGKKWDDLELELQAKKASSQKEGRQLLLAREAQQFVNMFLVANCPVCLTPLSQDELQGRISDGIRNCEANQLAATTVIMALQEAHDKCMTLKDQRQIQEKRLEEARAAAAQQDSSLRVLLSKPEQSSFSEINIDSHLKALDDAIAGLASESHSVEERSKLWKRRVETLRAELRFQEYRRRQEILNKRLIQGIEPIRERHRELIDLIDTVREIRNTLQTVFHEELDRTFPHLDEMMSEVYLRLTKQRSFETVHVTREKDSASSRKLRVSVGSNRTPHNRYSPEDVLNGQALSALRLVPYFVFSNFQRDSLEFDFLLIDDPSQSFDTSRVHLLLEELVKASSHAQLIVATHEVDRFAPHIASYFPADQLRLVRVAGFDPEGGPILVVDS